VLRFATVNGLNQLVSARSYGVGRVTGGSGAERVVTFGSSVARCAFTASVLGGPPAPVSVEPGAADGAVSVIASAPGRGFMLQAMCPPGA
jgi:hypothetical protein